MTLQEKMILFRAKNRLTQEEFGAMCGLSKMTINQIETGAQKPSKITYAKIMLTIGGGNNEAISKQD